MGKSLSIDSFAKSCPHGARILRDSVQSAMQSLRQSGPTQRSLRWEIEKGPDEVDCVLVGPPALHWVIYGRGPGGLPPYGVIEKWVSRKATARSAAGLAKQPNFYVNISRNINKGDSQAFINFAFAIQRKIQLQHTPEAASTVKEMMLIPGMSLGSARSTVRRGIGSGLKPPLQKIIDWMQSNGIEPNFDETTRIFIENLQHAIAKRGTRRFRLETLDPVAVGIENGFDEAVKSIFERWDH